MLKPAPFSSTALYLHIVQIPRLALDGQRDGAAADGAVFDGGAATL